MKTAGSRPTLADVARKAHVSKSTASLVLRGLGRFDSRTIASVLDAAKELGYRPNASARYLGAQDRTPMVALAFSELPDGDELPQMFWILALQSFTHELLRNSIATTIIPTIHNESLKSLPIEALVLVTEDPEDLNTPALQTLDAPLIVAGIQVDHEPAISAAPVEAWLHSDHYAVVTTALEHLRDAGATRPALLTTDVPMAYVHSFRIGGHRWLKANGLDELVVHSNDIVSSTIELINDGVDALIVLCSDYSPELDAVIETVEHQGRRIPEDVMIVALSQSGRAVFVNPNVTTVLHDGPTVGMDIARLIVNGHNTGTYDSISMTPKVTQRKSTMRNP